MTETPHTPLLPCPFCGSPAEFGIVTEGGEANPDYGGHFVQCTNERCHGCMGLRFACGDDPKPELLQAWNTRATPLPTTANNPETDAHRDLVEALREAIGAIEDDTGLDEAICCGGHDCGCRAATHRQLLLHDLRAALTKAEVTHGIL